jgi:hypothetical protein
VAAFEHLSAEGKPSRFRRSRWRACRSLRPGRRHTRRMERSSRAHQDAGDGGAGRCDPTLSRHTLVTHLSTTRRARLGDVRLLLLCAGRLASRAWRRTVVGVSLPHSGTRVQAS